MTQKATGLFQKLRQLAYIRPLFIFLLLAFCIRVLLPRPIHHHRAWPDQSSSVVMTNHAHHFRFETSLPPLRHHTPRTFREPMLPALNLPAHQVVEVRLHRRFQLSWLGDELYRPPC